MTDTMTVPPDVEQFMGDLMGIFRGSLLSYMTDLGDQVDPTAVLGNIRGALAPDGVFVMKEPHGADDIDGNLYSPMAPILYSVSSLHCMTVSLAHDGDGIGTMFGQGLARQLLADAGFASVDVLPAPGDPGDATYVCRRSAS